MPVVSQIGVVSPPPIYSKIIDPSSGRANIDWVRWFNSITQSFGATAASVGNVDLLSQSASIAATAVSTPSLATGLYRVNVYARVSRAATTSSSLSIAVGWTDGGVACNQTLGPVTSNTTATILQGQVVVSIDQATSLTYATTYASVGATTMQYKLSLSVEDLP